MYNLEKKRNGGDRKSAEWEKSDAQNEQLKNENDTATAVSKETGVSRATVVRAGQFASAVDALSENEPSVKAAILSGKSGLTRKSVVEIAAMGEGLFMFCGADGTYPGQPETAPCYPSGLANTA